MVSAKQVSSVFALLGIEKLPKKQADPNNKKMACEALDRQGIRGFELVASKIWRIKTLKVLLTLTTPDARERRGRLYQKLAKMKMFQYDSQVSPVDRNVALVHVTEDNRWICLNLKDGESQFVLNLRNSANDVSYVQKGCADFGTNTKKPPMPISREIRQEIRNQIIKVCEGFRAMTVGAMFALDGEPYGAEVSTFETRSVLNDFLVALDGPVC